LSSFPDFIGTRKIKRGMLLITCSRVLVSRHWSSSQSNAVSTRQRALIRLAPMVLKGQGRRLRLSRIQEDEPGYWWLHEAGLGTNPKYFKHPGELPAAGKYVYP